jgi:hypothetical protein
MTFASSSLTPLLSCPGRDSILAGVSSALVSGVTSLMKSFKQTKGHRDGQRARAQRRQRHCDNCASATF